MQLPPTYQPWGSEATRRWESAVTGQQIDEMLRRDRRRRRLEDARTALYGLGFAITIGLVVFQLTIVF